MKTHKIKICHVANSDSAVRFLLLNQLKFLLSQGYEVHVACSTGKFVKDIEASGITVHRINFRRTLLSLWHIVAFFRLFFYFKKEKFDIIHTHNPVPGFLGRLAAKAAGISVIVNTVHGFYFHEHTPLFKKIFFIRMEKIASACSDLIFFQSKEDMDTAAKNHISALGKMRYLGNGVDIKKFNQQRFSEDSLRRKKIQLNIPSDYKVVGIIARLVKEKGYLDLFLAFKEVLHRFPHTILLIIGPEDSAKKDAISKEVAGQYGIEKNVIFLGERLDVDVLYALMDVFVLPSWREGFPRSLIEAMAMSRPVIATQIRGCREAVDHGLNGILVPVKNSEELAKAIISLFKNPSYAQVLGNHARAKAEKSFDERFIFDRIEKGYSELIEKKLS